MKIKLVLFTLFLPIFSSAQNTHPVRFQTPEVTSFNRSIETPVSLSTGIPDINIPLYNVKIRGVEVPITLNYSGGGIKVNQEATWVGLGWNLNTGGEISRVQRGLKDEKFFLKADINDKIANFLNLPNSSIIPRRDAIRKAKDGLADYLPDEFYYTALGYSGRVMFNQSQNKVILYPKEDIKPTYTISNINLAGYQTEDRLDSWRFQLPDGTSINYGTYGASTDEMSNSEGETRNSWNIKSISNKFNDQINYIYEPLTYTSDNLAGEVYNIRSFNYSSFIQATTFRTNYLNSINFLGGKVEFVTGSRLDMPTKCLNMINIYDQDNILVKRIEFIYSYFNGDYGTMPLMSYITADQRTKRLKLDKIRISGKGIESLEYKFDYYNGNNYVPSKYSASQDFWGYFNGRANSTLIPKTIVEYGADRTPSPNDNQIFSLRSITYPEGGRTEFSYECNTARSSSIPSYFLTPGGTTNSFYVGGIRVKSIKNYNDNGAITTQRFYDYSNELGTTSGWLLSIPSFWENVRVVEGRLDHQHQIYTPWPKFDTRLYSSSRVPMETTGGASSGYEMVTEEFMGLTPEENIKSKYYYTFRDSYYETGSKRTERELIDANEWLRGKLDSVSYLKNGLPIKKEIYEYHRISPHNNYDYEEDFVEEINTDFISYQAFAEDGFASPITLREDFYDDRGVSISGPIAGFNYYIRNIIDNQGYQLKVPYFKRYTGFNKIKRKKIITYDGLKKVEQNENYFYDSTPNHHQLTRNETISSKGENLKSIIKYPKDMVGMPYTTMSENNIINLPIEKATYLNTKLIQKNLTNYLSYLVPDNEQEQIGSGVLETKNKYQYDAKYTLREISRDGSKEAYLWDGISYQYPTAKIFNAASTDIAYTSFEIANLITDGDGGWVFRGYADTLQANIPVGRRCYPTTITSTITHSGLSSTKLYDLTYWSKSSSYNVSGSQSLSQVKTLDGWTQFRHKITGISTITISGTAGYIDDLRISPTKSSASTYSYSSLGLLFFRNLNEHSNHYEYDGLQRLKNIKDQDKNIIKNTSIHYKGIAPVLYKNVQLTKYFIKNNCGNGTRTDSIPFTIFANTFTSKISQIDADNLAKNSLNSNGQSYVNSIGICKFYNSLKSAAFAKSDCGAGRSGSSMLYTISAGSYSSTISQGDADAKADTALILHGQANADNSGTCSIYSATINAYYNNLVSSYWSVKATNINTGTIYSGTMGAGYNGSLFSSIPSGFYNLLISSLGPSPSSPTNFIINNVSKQIVPASYSGNIVFNNIAINSASTNPLIKVENGSIPISCSFSGSPGWQIHTFNISTINALTTNLSIICSGSYTGNTWSSANTIGYIIGTCSPSNQRQLNITENGRIWEAIIYPTGQVTVRLSSGTAPSPGSQITFTGSYNL